MGEDAIVSGEGGYGLGGELEEAGGVTRSVVAFLEVIAVFWGEAGGLDFLELVAEEFEFLL